jgi:acyl-CoA synthetase (NDP forming)/RimJ/RimL family protein N-acetyltransferase
VTARNIDVFLRPATVVVLGPARTAGQQQLFANLEASVAPERRVLVGAEAAGWRTAAEAVEPAELAVAFDGRLLRPETLAQLAAGGCRGLIWATDVPVAPDCLTAARAANLRILGARSAGTASPDSGFNASAYAPSPAGGRLALIAQSRTVAAAALDWARGRNLGFAWIATTGAEADVDIADLLDHAAVDPAVRGVAVQLGRIVDGRRFMSAARAAARAKPVAVLQTRATGARHGVGPDPVRSAAFARAGLVKCDTLSGLFDALTAVERMAALSEARVIVLGNGAGVCALGVDALLRHGVPLSNPSEDVSAELCARLPLARIVEGAVDVGTLPPDEIAATAAWLIEREVADAVLLVHSPEPGQPHQAVAEAVARSRSAARMLTVWLGLATARDARAYCAAHGVPTFAAPDEAAQALSTLRRHRLNQELLTQTPLLAEAHTLRARQVEAALRTLAETAEPAARDSAALKLLEAYGVGSDGRERDGAVAIHAGFDRHPQMGAYLFLRVAAEPAQLPTAYGFPPLDGLLARRLLEAVGLEWAGDADHGALPRLLLALLRLSDLAVEQAQLQSLTLRVAASADGARCWISDVSAVVDPAPPPERRRLALAPYPSALTHVAQLGGGTAYRVRAVRPEDEPAMIRMLESIEPDAIRMRFFRTIRHFSHAMAARLTQVDYDRELGLVALPEHATEGTSDADVVAVAHLLAEPDGTRAEYAILVHQKHGGIGLGRHLMECLLDFAAQHGIQSVYGEVLTENRPMLGLCRALGFSIRPDPDEPECRRVEIDPRSFRRAPAAQGPGLPSA